MTASRDAVPIEDYGAIGDGRSVALISRTGSLDWLCWPRFDAPALFAGILDPGRGGRFEIRPARGAPDGRRYLPETNVLETRFRAETGALVLTDAMTLQSERPGALAPEHELLREAACTGGQVDVHVRCDPRPGFGARDAAFAPAGGWGWRFDLGRAVLHLRAAVTSPDSAGRADRAWLRPDPEGGLTGTIPLRAGERLLLSLTYAEAGPAVLPPLPELARDRIAHAAAWWQAWTAQRPYDGPYRDAVIRSALVLKLLSFAPSGAVVAAPTTSLPERPGGDLNWDYRFCWLRDAALTIRALYGLGCPAEARAFVSWLLHATRMSLPQVHVLYDVYGRRPFPERELAHLSGWGGARPVRIGNAAVDQLQLDVYGEVIDAVVRFVEAEATDLDRQVRRMLREMGEWVCRNWERPDAGIWEPRDVARRHVHSLAMCWLALDGLLRLNARGALPRIPAEMFRKNRGMIRDVIEGEGFDEGLGAYTQALGDRGLDAAVLRLPALGYTRADSPRMRATVRRIRADLGTGPGLVYRYDQSRADGEGAFGICGFWLADALARGAGTLEEAREAFDALLARASDLGLFAEEIDPVTGAALGNFPQAYTHVGLVNAALSIQAREQTERRRPPPSPPEVRP
jgi:GH15 family glucan-1,4-alpha-glucosidase